MRRNKPPHDAESLEVSALCGAKLRGGGACLAAVANGRSRCRLHGGAPGSGAPVGNGNAWKHGHYSADAVAERRRLGALVRMARKALAELKPRQFPEVSR
jgi:hypothetical protein